MRRTQIYITDEQERLIKARAADARLSKAEVIRGILDTALGLDDGLAKRRAAILATAGLLEDTDDWEAWLADVRGGEGATARLDDLGSTAGAQ